PAVHADQDVVTGPVEPTPVMRWFARQPVNHDHYNQSVLLECRPGVWPEILDQALTALITHHDALRLRVSAGAARIVPPDGRSVLHIAPDHDINSRLSLADGPIVAAALLPDDRLRIVVHHIAVDAVSWHILLADLATACAQLEAGQPVILPAKSTSFQRWAERLAEYPVETVTPEGGRLPVDHSDGRNTEESERAVDVALSAELTDSLVHRVPAAYRTEINDVLLTALAVTVAEWTGDDSAFVEIEGHGREQLGDDVDVSRTVGWFTNLLPIGLRVTGQGWGDRLKAVKERLRAVTRVESTRPAELCFNYLGRLDQQRGEPGRFTEAPDVLGARRDPRAERSYLLDITAGIEAGTLQLSWGYSANRHDQQTVHQLAESYLANLTALIDHCLTNTGATPSDFPLAGLDQSTLDGLLTGVAGVVEDVYPLSPLQTGMLFHSTYDEDSRQYLEQLGFVIHGDLDVDAFERAWQRVVDRHAVLRTRFLWQGLPAPMQVVLRDQRVRIEQPTCSLADYLVADAERGIDLVACPARFAVLATGPDEYSFVWTFHHVMLDRWSVSAVLDEVFALYHGRTVDHEPARYRDHIAWLAAQDRTEEAAFWRHELDGFTEPKPLPVRTGLNLSRVEARFPADLAEQVRELAQRARCTVNTVLHAAWGLLLSRYTGTDDVLFGTTVAGRGADVRGIEHMVGLLINTIPTRMTIDQDASVLDHLAVHHARLLELRDHEHSALVDIHRCTDVPAGTPLFDTRFVYENFGDGEDSGLDVESVEDILERTSYPVVVEVHHGTEIDVAVRSTVDGMPLLDHFVHLVRQLATCPEDRMGAIELLTPAQRDRMLREWNDTAVPIPDRTLAELFEDQVETAPDSIALVDRHGRTITYAELNTRANRLANHLRSLGVACETPVGICLERSVDLIVAALAVVKAGGAYLPLDPGHPADRLAYMIEDSGIDIVVATDLTGYHGTLVDPGAGSVTDNPTPLSGPGNLAYVMYKSDSTGRPTSVLVEQRSVVRLVRGQSYADFTPHAVWLQLASMSFDVFAFEVWGSLLGGGRLVIGPPELPTATRLRRLITDHGVTQLWLTGSLFNIAVDEDPTVLSGIERLVVGREALSVRHVRAARRALPGMTVTNGYGPTEATVFATCHPVVDVPDDALAVPIGRPIANTETYVLDTELRPVPVGVVGELCIGGVGVARGYSNRPGLTADRFVPNPFGSGRLYRTGDLARWTEDGLLEQLGRADHQVTVRGRRIEPGGIEARLRIHPQVGDAVVTVRDGMLVGYLAPAGTGLPTVSEIREFLAHDLPEDMIPAVWVPLDGFPLTLTARIDREALPDPEAVDAGAGYVPPADDVESALADMWSQVLYVDRVGVRDDFFELGGDSILAIQIVARARQAGLAITLRQMFEQRTIARLAAAVRSTTATAVHAEQGLVVGPVELTPMMHWFTEVHPGRDHDNESVVLACRPGVAPEVLDRALTTVIEQHDALRLRLVDGSASIAPPDGRSVLLVTDSDAPAGESQRGPSLVDGPLLRATLSGDRLRIVIHRLVVDTESWHTILTDLATACAQVEAGEPIRLPAKTTSFQQWARRLADYARSTDFEAEARYWAGLRAPNTELPVDHETGPNDEGHARIVEAALPAALTEALSHDVPAAYRTDVNDILLTALAATLTEWAGGALVALEHHGREPLFEGVDLSRTVGSFTSVLPAHLPVPQGDWGERLNAVKEFLRSIPNHGIGHGMTRYLRADPGTVSPAISFTCADGPAEQRGAAGRFTELTEHRAADRADDCRRPYLIDVHAVIADDRLRLTWTYSTERHRETTIRALADNYVARLTELIEYCAATDGGATPSDFPLADLAQEQVDHLLHDLRRRQIDPRQIEDVRPLSPSRAGMLFHTAGTPDSTDHFMQRGHLIRGDFDESAFVAALQHTVDRHAALRAVLVWDGLPAPVQVTLRHRDADVRRPTGLIEDAIRAGRADRFDLADATPCRFTLLAAASDEHYFLWTYHHVLLDGWSASSVLDDIFASYEEFR
ncbi:MAG TPA: amino acid adenylation domain-containing protein, partial [Pseudonocardiaceae bacterium]